MRKAYKILVWKPIRNRPFGSPTHKWQDIRMCFRETGWEVVEWIILARDRDQ